MKKESEAARQLKFNLEIVTVMTNIEFHTKTLHAEGQSEDEKPAGVTRVSYDRPNHNGDDRPSNLGVRNFPTLNDAVVATDFTREMVERISRIQQDEAEY